VLNECRKLVCFTHGGGKDSTHSLRRLLIPGEAGAFLGDAVEVPGFLGDAVEILGFLEEARGMIIGSNDRSVIRFQGRRGRPSRVKYNSPYLSLSSGFQSFEYTSHRYEGFNNEEG
jgi:hypothetical protein